MSSPLELIPVQDSVTRQAAEMLIREYLEFIRDKATHEYGLAFDIEAMAASDLHDESKFFPPAGRFYVVRHSGQHIGVGCLKRLTPAVAEIQRMYIQPSARGLGAGRFLLAVKSVNGKGKTTTSPFTIKTSSQNIFNKYVIH